MSMYRYIYRLLNIILVCHAVLATIMSICTHTEDGYQNIDGFTYEKNRIVTNMTRMFYFPCVLTGQYIPSYSDLKHQIFGVCILLLFLFNVLLNIGSVGFDFYAIICCNFSEHCGFIYTLPPMRNISGASHKLGMQAPLLTQFHDWQKLVITTATISGALSFFLMACVLYGRYCIISKYVYYQPGVLSLSALIKKSNCCEPTHHKDAAKRNPNVLIVNPFFDETYSAHDVMDKSIKLGDGKIEDQFLSSLVTPKQCVYFQSIFVLNFSVYLVNVALLIVILDRQLASFNKSLEAIDLLGLIAQLVSRFSALMSCFIFSKVAYAVSNQCLDFTRCIFPHIMKRDGCRLNDLKDMDKRYTLLLRNSLGPYSVWFTIHWILYTVSSLMAIAYVADQIIMELYGTELADKKCHGEYDLDCRLNLAYSIFFALEHCMLFLYPCFRAASVTRARAKMIKYVSNADWPNITDQDKNAFITYLKDQNASFKISILCAELTFGFNMAYLSIFIGVLGIVMKLSL